MEQIPQNQPKISFLEQFGEAFKVQINIQLKNVLQEARDVKTALINRKQYLSQGKRLFMPQLGQQFKLNEQQCNQAIQQLQEHYLENWGAKFIQQIKDEIRRTWMDTPESNISAKKTKIKHFIEKQHKIKEQHNKNYKEIYNVIQYQLKILANQ
ncbi:Hypothetical_protein [Hexamita inflata]|uniref:Hypothetical_protein n=1 Tax=Hexamita inflata TaxID=28002 RepID=A0AA86U037_9EUKA|nr:Hypothetical protein HINF_LOCUS14253 [Hexamita inflata]